MKSPVLWIMFAALFSFTGVMHIVRSRRPNEPKAEVNRIFGITSFMWAVTVLVFRFVSHSAALVLAVSSAIGMLYAAFISMKLQGSKK